WHHQGLLRPDGYDGPPRGVVRFAAGPAAGAGGPPSGSPPPVCGGRHQSRATHGQGAAHRGGHVVLVSPAARHAARRGHYLRQPGEPDRGGHGPGGRLGAVFTAPPIAAAALAQAGFDIVSTANNHAWDGGEATLQETMRQLT